MKIRGSVAIVTGASSGIGAVTAEALTSSGAKVVAVARRSDLLDEVVARCGHDATAIVGDVSDRAFAERVVREVGRVDILVNNAGISPGEQVTTRAADDAERIMKVNFFGAIYFAGVVLPGMLERKHGSIVNVTSVSGYVPAPGEPAYGA